MSPPTPWLAASRPGSSACAIPPSGCAGPTRSSPTRRRPRRWPRLLRNRRRGWERRVPDSEEKLDREGAVKRLNAALALQYRSVLQYSIAAASLLGIEAQAVGEKLTGF